MRGGHDRRARASVAGEDHRSPRTGRTDQAFWSDRPTVRQSDRFTLRELAPKGALRDPRRLGFLGVEPPAPLVLLQRVPDGPEKAKAAGRSEEHTSELQSLRHLVCRLRLE